jgi:hypothetical protein
MYKTIPSGFLLAILACQYLYENGCELWDLGGVNHCPLMRYKYDLTGNQPEERPIAFHWFHHHLKELREKEEEVGSGTEKQQYRLFPTGMIIDSVMIDHIL